jgi:hypothetical protein
MKSTATSKEIREVLRFKVFSILVLVVSLLAASTASAQTPPTASFLARMDYAVGADPQGIVVGDLRSNGSLDVVTVGYGGDVSVLLNKGDGTFEPAVHYPAPAPSNIVQLGDFNCDGKPDILVATPSTPFSIASVSVFLGNGDGTFQAPKLTTIANSNRLCLAVGDFNGDGKLDLAFPVAVAQFGDSAMNVMLGMATAPSKRRLPRILAPSQLRLILTCRPWISTAMENWTLCRGQVQRFLCSSARAMAPSSNR